MHHNTKICPAIKISEWITNYYLQQNDNSKQSDKPA